MSIKFEFLPRPGESILITIDNNFRILMDAGNSHPFKKEFFKLGIPIPKIDMLIITHIDRDHIGGAISLLKDTNHFNKIKYILFNEPESCNIFSLPNQGNTVSAGNGSSLLELLKGKNIEHIKEIYVGNKKTEQRINEIIPNTKITILSPTHQNLTKLLSFWNPETYKPKNTVSGKIHQPAKGSMLELASFQTKMDTSIPNGSSLAFLIEYNKKSFLLLGDAHIDIICNSLENINPNNPLIAEFIKLSHHGSIRNINSELIERVLTSKYIIINQSEKSHLPNKETIAKIAVINHKMKRKKIKFFITKKINKNVSFSEEERNRYNFDIIDQKTTLEYF